MKKVHYIVQSHHFSRFSYKWVCSIIVSMKRLKIGSWRRIFLMCENYLWHIWSDVNPHVGRSYMSQHRRVTYMIIYVTPVWHIWSVTYMVQQRLNRFSYWTRLHFRVFRLPIFKRYNTDKPTDYAFIWQWLRDEWAVSGLYWITR